MGRLFEVLFPGRALKLAELDAMRAGVRMREALAAYALDQFVDPLDALRDDDTGELWLSVGATPREPAQVPRTEYELTSLRDECRRLAASNPFAINGHENRISYIVGTGHGYTVTAIDEGTAEESIAEVQTIVDEWIKEAGWHQRQQEIVRRMDRDGECFLRFFPDAEGLVQVRFVEPGLVMQPASNQTDTWGIETDPDDVETVTGYWIDGERVSAEEIQHRKGNVDSNVKRGLPLFYSVRKNLKRAEKLLRNMGVVADIQTAIAMIRKHPAAAATGEGLANFVAQKADVQTTNNVTGKTTYHQHWGAGTIVDTTSEHEYEFPATGIDAGRYVAVLQAELRAIASRLVMPEFMLSSDASNANYSSTMVAEGPAVKMFERWQWTMIAADLEVLDRVLDEAVAAGRLSQEVREAVSIDVQPPRLTSRDRLKEVQADGLLVDKRIMSVRTAMVRNELDPDVEEQQIEDERERNDPYAGLGFGGSPFGEPPDDGPDDDDTPPTTEAEDEGDRWVTIRGNPVLIGAGGEIKKGPKGMVGKKVGDIGKTKKDDGGKKAEYKPSLKIKASKTRAFTGQPAAVRTKLSKQQAGKIGEDIIIAHLQEQGKKDARPLNLDKSNFPIDLVQDSEVIEAKAGNAGNNKSAQQWRLTIGEPGKAEKEWLAQASAEEKEAWNAKKQKAIHARKEKIIRDLSKELKKPIKAATMTVIINPDTKTADIYRFEGFHDRIGWNSAEAKKAYVRSVRYG